MSPEPVPAKELPTAASKAPLQKQTVQAQLPRDEQTAIEKANVKAVMFGGIDLNDIIYTVLQCLSHISEKRYYGISILADVLRGANSKRIVNSELNKLPEYGRLKGVRRDDLITIIEWLIDNHFILKTKHPTYPVLHPTYEGTHYNETMTANKLRKLQSILQER